MTTTLGDMPATRKPKPAPSEEDLAAKELVAFAKDQGLSLTGPEVCSSSSPRRSSGPALNEEMSAHLGPQKNRAPEARGSVHVRNGTRPKTVLSHATGEVELPRDREGTFEPVINEVAAAPVDRGRRDRSLAVRDGSDTGEISVHFAQIYGCRWSRNCRCRP